MNRFLLGAVCALGVMAQSGPPTYDYDSLTPGTQGPQSPLLAGYTYRSVRAYQVAIPVLVPRAELQALLPAGFVPIATPAGSDTATVTLNFFLDQRFQPQVNGEVYGPTTALLATTNATNTTLSQPRTEILFPIFEVSGGEAELNAVFGANAARKAKVTAEIEQEEGTMKFKFKVVDGGIGMNLEASAEGSMNINTRAKSDPVGIPFRSFSGFTPNNAFWAASQSDTLAVPAATAKAKVSAPNGRLQMVTGSLPILGFGANVTFSRGVEFFLRFE